MRRAKIGRTDEMTKPPRSPSKRQARPDFRQRLLDGLEQSIREIGLQRTQIGDIVRNARTSNRTFYECFTDKEACFVELIDEWSRETSVAVQAAIDPEVRWDQRIDQAVDAYIGILATKPELTVTVTRELPALGNRGIELQEEDIDRYVQMLMEMTGNPEMSDAGVTPVDSWTAAMLIGGVAEILDRANREGVPLESVAGTIKRVIKLVIGSASQP
jgi:AcrR family transcriptional regulator